MSDTSGLNVGATTFTPGGGGNAARTPPVAYEDDEPYDHGTDDEILDALEAEMINLEMDALTAEMNGAAISTHAASVATSSLPSHLSGHAAEFWFPECRNCTCCKGYKYGCSCDNECKCTRGDEVSKPAPRTTAKNISLGKAAGSGDHAGSIGQSKPPPPCRFFQSPSGCRFGDKCRFSHAF